MRKNNLKRLLFFGIVFILFGCSEDFYETENYDSGLIFKLLSREQILANQKLTLKINEVERTNSQIQGKIVYDTIYNFTINTNSATYINNLGIETYTFEVQRTLGDGKLENLVIREKPNGEFDSFLVKYGFTIEQKLLENFNPNQYSNPIYTLIDFDYQILLTGRCIYTSTVDCEEIWSVNCSTVPPRQGESDGGGSIDQVESCSWTMSIGNCMVNLNESCTGGSGDFGGATTSPHSSGGGSNTFPDTPCGRMQKKSSETVFKQKIKDLNKDANFKKRFETGYYEKADGSLNFMTGLDISGKRTLKFPPGATSFMHIHMNNVPVQDEEGNPYIEYFVKMLSPGDVGGLIGAAGNSIVGNLSPYEAYGLMLSNEGVFSISLTDINIAMSDELKVQMDNEYIKRAMKIFKDTSPNTLNRKKALQKMLLVILKENNFGDKVALFEAEIIIELGETLPTINWIRKALDANNELIEEPC